MLLIMLFNRNSWYVVIVTDTHQKLLLCRQGGRPLHSQNLSVLFPPLYPWTSANRVCVGNKGRKEHSPLPRGIKHKSTDAQVLEFKPLSFMDPKQKIQADENTGPICLTSCFLWSHTQLYFPEEPEWSTPLQPPNSNKSSPWRTSHSPSCGGLYDLKHAVCLEPPARLSVTWHAIQITATRSAFDVHIMFLLASSEWKSRTELVEAACVKWAQLREHYLVEKYNLNAALST